MKAAALVVLVLGLSSLAGSAPASGPERGPAATQPELLPDEQIDPLPAADAYARMIDWIAAGKQSEAEQILRHLAATYPNDQKIAFAAAVLERSRFDIEGARPLLLHAQSLDPKSDLGHCAADMLAIDARKRVGPAFADLSKTANQQNADPMILWLGGIASRTLNQNAAGAECYRNLLKQWNPGPVLVHQTFANLLDELHQYDEALVHRAVAVKMEPSGWSAEGLALTLWHLKRYDEADKAFAASLEFSPSAGSYYDAWADMLLEQGHFDDAVDRCRSALKIDDHDLHALNTWGRILARKKDYDGAAAKFSECLRLEPRYYFALNNLAEISERSGQFQQAIEYRLAAVRVAPTAENLAGLARLYTHTGQLPLAEAAFAQASAMEPANASIVADWSLALLDAGHPADALKKAREALARNPKSASALYVAGAVTQSTGKTAAETREAIQLFRSAIQANPAYWPPYIHLADLLTDPADAAEARDLRRKGAELHDAAGL